MYIIRTVKSEFGFFQDSASYILNPTSGIKRVQAANRLGSRGERPARTWTGQMPKTACLMLLFTFLSAARAEFDAVIEVRKEFITVHPGAPPAQMTPSDEGGRRRSGIIPELPSGYEHWHEERDTAGLERGSRGYVSETITAPTVRTRSADAIAVAAPPATAPAAPVLAEVLGRRGADKVPSCRRPDAFKKRLLTGEAVGDIGQLSGRSNAGREEPGRGVGSAGGGGGRASDPGGPRRVAAVLDQVPLHSTVMYVTNHGTFVRRHIPAPSRTPITANVGEAQKVRGGGGGGGNSTPVGGEGGYGPRATGATATATAARPSADAKLGETEETARRWSMGQWSRSAGQSIRPSSQLEHLAGGEAGSSDDDRGGCRSCSRGSDGTAGGGCGDSRRSRQLTQQLMQQDSAVDSASVTFNPRLACEGCPPGDPRVRVLQPREPPFAAVGLLAQEQRRLLSGSVSQCTATLIGPRHLITAAHCVVAPDRWSFIEQVRWFPQLDTAESNTQVRSLPVRTIRVLERYIRLGSASLAALNYDFALLTLDQALPPNTFTLSIAPGQGQAVMDLETAGYPGDKPRGTMWTVRCSRVKFNFEGTELEGCGEGCENMVIHDCVSWEGQSGSAMWETAMLSGSSTAETSPPPVSPPSPIPPSPTVRAQEANANRSIGNNTIRAILTGVIKFDDGTTYNVGTELNDFVYGTIATWYNEDLQMREAQLEVPPGYQGGSPAAKINTDTPKGSDGGETSRSWIGDHIFVPVLVGAGGLLLVSLLVALCAFPFQLIAHRRVL